MIPRKILAILLYMLAVLVVCAAVFLGASTILGATNDMAASIVLRWIGWSCLLLVIIDVILMAAVLGIDALGERDEESGSMH